MAERKKKWRDFDKLGVYVQRGNRLYSDVMSVCCSWPQGMCCKTGQNGHVSKEQLIVMLIVHISVEINMYTTHKVRTLCVEVMAISKSGLLLLNKYFIITS